MTKKFARSVLFVLTFANTHFQEKTELKRTFIIVTIGALVTLLLACPIFGLIVYQTVDFAEINIQQRVDLRSGDVYFHDVLYLQFGPSETNTGEPLRAALLNLQTIRPDSSGTAFQGRFLWPDRSFNFYCTSTQGCLAP